MQTYQPKHQHAIEPPPVDLPVPILNKPGVAQFFKPPKIDNRGNSTLADEDVVAENVDPLDEEDDVEEICTSSNEGNSLPVSVLEHYVDEIRQAAGDESTDDDLVSGNNEEDAATATEDVCNETFLRRNHRTLLLIILSG